MLPPVVRRITTKIQAYEESHPTLSQLWHNVITSRWNNLRHSIEECEVVLATLEDIKDPDPRTLLLLVLAFTPQDN